MCASEGVVARADDVWADSSDGGGSDAGPGSPSAASRAQLDREWEARKQQYYNAGYREGVEEGKEGTLQQGFNAGFAEGAHAGHEFGLVKSALQVLAAHLPEADSRRAKVQELLQQVSALSGRTVLQDTCKALLTQEPADIISRHLQAALTLAGDPADTRPSDEAGSSSSQEPTQSAAAAAAAGATDGALASSSSTRAAELPLPLQLVARLKEELQQLGFDVGSTPALTVASTSSSQQVASDGGGVE